MVLFNVSILFVLAYFIGSVPTGYWLCKYFFKIDVTEHGSGNIGATNVARVLKGGIKYFILVFLIDACKAFLTLFFSFHYFIQRMHLDVTQAQNYLLILACALLLGNAHSIFLQFKGGKGVATTLGIVAYLIPTPLLFLFVFSWIALIVVTKRAFMASIGAMIILTLMYGLMFYTPNNLLFYFLVVICYWVALRHKSNIRIFLKH